MLPLPWVDELFKRFEAMYGAQFVQKWQDCDIAMVKQEWADALHSMSGETIKAALQACREQCKFPPSSPEFYQLCKQFRSASHQLTLDKPRSNKEFANARIAEAAEVLAKKMRVNL